MHLDANIPTHIQGCRAPACRAPGRILSAVLLLLLCAVSARAELQVSVPGRDANVSFRPFSDNQVQATVLDGRGDPITGLGVSDFVIQRDGKTARVLSVETLMTRRDVPLNIVLVVDNSASMKMRKAIQPLLAALDGLLGKIRPMDRVTLITFNEKSRLRVGDRDLPLGWMQSSDPHQLREFLRHSYFERLTDGTYLYDAMYAGVHTARDLAAQGAVFLVVFSDGEEINSTVKAAEVTAAAVDGGFRAYAVDYMPKPEPDPFLAAFSRDNGGKAWKADSADQLLPIFEEVSTALFHPYIVTYRFLLPPKVGLTLEPETLRIQEVTTIDSSPLLHHLFFDTGSSHIPDRYRLLSGRSETGAFDPAGLKDTMDKYLHLLNVVGRRLAETPEAALRVVGCNADVGPERQRMDLSRSRADAVAAYLRYVWGIDPGRIQVDARNLPQAPSTSRVPEGRVENQRAELYSDHPAILATVESSYVDKVADARAFRIRFDWQVEAGIDRWQLVLKGDGKTEIARLAGNGAPSLYAEIPLGADELSRLADFTYVTAGMEVIDREGEVFRDDAAALATVLFEKREAMLAQKKGYTVFEKYALILFDFDSHAIQGKNREIVDRILDRVGRLPAPRVTVTGHTDTIGSEDYNQALSFRRAKAVYDMLVGRLDPGIAVTHEGKGEFAPIYDNALPEGRSLNRTVTITLEYLQME